MKHCILLILVISFSFTSCKKLSQKKDPKIEIIFQTGINENEVDLNTEFSDSQNRMIRLELIKFYISDLEYINSDNESFEVEDLALIELNQEGQSKLKINIPAGDYQSINFGIGVPKTLNETNPSEFKEKGHPLNTLNNTYWGMNSMYRFVMIDGRYFINGIFQNAFSYHSGYNESYREIKLPITKTYNNKESYSEKIIIDISKVLEGSGGELDIKNEPDFHGNIDDYHLSKTLSDNFQTAFSIH